MPKTTAPNLVTISRATLETLTRFASVPEAPPARFPEESSEDYEEWKANRAALIKAHAEAKRSLATTFCINRQPLSGESIQFGTNTVSLKPVCKGAWGMGNACGKCSKCEATRPTKEPH